MKRLLAILAGAAGIAYLVRRASAPAAPAPASGGGPAQPPPPPVAVHPVGRGDTLGTVAARYLGSSDLWPLVWDRNRDQIGSDPDGIEVGMVLAFPGVLSAYPAAEVAAARRRSAEHARLWRSWAAGGSRGTGPDLPASVTTPWTPPVMAGVGRTLLSLALPVIGLALLLSPVVAQAQIAGSLLSAGRPPAYPVGPAGGLLSGTYPNPATIGMGTVPTVAGLPACTATNNGWVYQVGDPLDTNTGWPAYLCIFVGGFGFYLEEPPITRVPIDKNNATRLGGVISNTYDLGSGSTTVSMYPWSDVTDTYTDALPRSVEVVLLAAAGTNTLDVKLYTGIGPSVLWATVRMRAGQRIVFTANGTSAADYGVQVISTGLPSDPNNGTVLNGQRNLRVSTAGGAKTYTLPACGAAQVGWEVIEAKLVTAGNLLTINAAGADTIDGAAGVSSAVAGTFWRLKCAATGQWDVQ